MLFEKYAEKSLLCNVSVQGETGSYYVFRGDMVIEEGEIADTQGRRLPPRSVLKQAVVLEEAEKLTLIAGAVDDLAYLPEFIAKYKEDFAENIELLFYVSNLTKPFKVDFEGSTAILIPHEEGAVWTMLMDDLRLEKSDFKGQSAEEKVLTMYESVKEFNPSYSAIAYTEAGTYTTEIKREARGPV